MGGKELCEEEGALEEEGVPPSLILSLGKVVLVVFSLVSTSVGRDMVVLVLRV